MNFETPNFLPAIPEMYLLAMACIVLLVDLFLSDRTRIVTYYMSQATLIGGLILVLGQFGQPTQLTFSDTYILDPMANVLKLFALGATFFVFLYSKDYLRHRNMFHGEFFTLGLFGVLGMMILISAHNLLTVYMGLELLSLCMYAMVALQRDNVVASEAAMKYFVLGAMASAMLLYGMSMIYGVTGSLDLAEISSAIGSVNDGNIVLVFGLVFIIVGIAFKLGAVPFHMWVPDVYHGAPTAVTLYISTAPKLAAFAMAMRLLVDGLGGIHAQWQDILILLAILSLAAGNIIAIAQANMKRMLAYSAIAHISFILFGILAGTSNGYSSAMFYAITYVIMGMGGFGVVLLMSRNGFEADKLDDYKGLNQRSPWFAFVMLIFMFSMAGMPPFLGFWAKMAVIQALVDVELIWLATFAVVFSVIGAFYYLRIIKLMYFDKPEESAEIESSLDMRVALSANGLAVLVLGLSPGALMALCVTAIG